MRTTGLDARASARRLMLRRAGGLGPVLQALALLAWPGLGQAQPAPAFSPCLAPRDDVEAYARAFEAQGWTRASGEARAATLLGPAEAYYRLLHFPDPEATAAELDATLAEVGPWAADRLAGAVVLGRGDAAALVWLDPSSVGLRLLCIVAAPDLPEADTFLGRAVEPGPFGGLQIHATTSPAPPGLGDFRLDAVRLPRPADLPAPRPGTEAVVVTAFVGDAP